MEQHSGRQWGRPDNGEVGWWPKTKSVMFGKLGRAWLETRSNDG
jgi:hypothetical protein